jgi:hypothetical protein
MFSTTTVVKVQVYMDEDSFCLRGSIKNWRLALEEKIVVVSVSEF